MTSMVAPVNSTVSCAPDCRKFVTRAAGQRQEQARRVAARLEPGGQAVQPGELERAHAVLADPGDHDGSGLRRR